VHRSDDRANRELPFEPEPQIGEHRQNRDDDAERPALHQFAGDARTDGLDAAELIRVAEGLPQLVDRRLLALLAGRSGGLLVPTTLAAESGIPRTTLTRYLELLTTVFLTKEVPAWSASQTRRAIGTPKLAFVDTGIATHLLGQDAARLGEPDGAAGPMMETFVLMELARQLTWSSERARLYHYRTKDKVEVDAVLETPDGRVVAVEVKAGATVRTGDLAGLRHLAQRLGSRFVAGYVLYTGQQTLPFGDRLRALPIDALWHTAP